MHIPNMYILNGLQNHHHNNHACNTAFGVHRQPWYLEEHVSTSQLRHNTAKAPDVNAASIGQPQHNLRGPVAAALHVARAAVGHKAAAAEVDDLDLAPGVALDEDVFGLEVAVDEVEGVQKCQGPKNLQRRPFFILFYFVNPQGVERQGWGDVTERMLTVGTHSKQ